MTYRVSIKNLMILIVGVALSSCATSSPKSPYDSSYKPTYKSLIQIHSDHQALANYTASAIAGSETLLLADPTDFTQYSLILTTEPVRPALDTPKPILLGKLQKKTLPLEFTIHYKLTNARATLLKEGDLTFKSEETTAIYPRLGSSKDIPIETLEKASAEIINTLTPFLTKADWATTVIAHKDQYHATITAPESSGLKYGDLFETMREPYGLLSVVEFEKLGNSNRTLLRLQEGFLPAIGTNLVPAGKLTGRKSRRPTAEEKLQGAKPLPSNRIELESTPIPLDEMMR